MEKLLKTIGELSDGILAIAKSLKDGNTEDAIAELQKTADTLTQTQEQAEALQKEENPEATPEATPGEGEGEGGAEGEEAPEEVVEKVTLEVTKTQAEALTKFADMYISGDNIGKLFQALVNSGADVESIFKTVKANSEEIEKLKKVKSAQITKTADAKASVWDGLDLV